MSSKRPRPDSDAGVEDDGQQAKRRRTRFSEQPSDGPPAAANGGGGAGVDVQAALARAQAIAASLGQRPPRSTWSALQQSAVMRPELLVEESAEERRRRNAAKRAVLAAPLILDEKGRDIAALQKEQEEEEAQEEPSAKAEAEEGAPAPPEVRNPYLAHWNPHDEGDSAVWDPRVASTKHGRRGRRAFVFREAKHEEQDEAEEEEAEEEEAEEEEGGGGEEGEEGGGEAAGTSVLSQPQPAVFPPRYTSEPPDLEWWDVQLLPAAERRRREQAAATDTEPPTHTIEDARGWESRLKSASLVQHPVPIVAVEDPSRLPQALPLMYTKKEKKRLRRARRRERVEERQLQQQLGLIKAPDPKLRVANLMRVMKDEAVANPSKAEALARGATEARIKSHQMRNLASKLTPEERRARRKEKMTESDVTGVHVAVFRVADLSNPSHRFKVDANARQFYLSGIALMVPNENVNLVLVEGGPRAVKKYIRLMTNRIQWHVKAEEEGEGEEGEEEEGGRGGTTVGEAGEKERVMEDDDVVRHRNRLPQTTEPTADISPEERRKLCELVWQGTSTTRAFRMFRFEPAANSAMARKIMQSRGLVQHWDRVAASAASHGFTAPSGAPIAGAGVAVVLDREGAGGGEESDELLLP